MDRLVRAVPLAQVAVAVPVADLALHRIVRPAGTELQTTKNRQENHAYPPEVNPFAILSREADRVYARASDIMSRKLQTVTPETPIEDAARIMQSNKISALLVVHAVLNVLRMS